MPTNRVRDAVVYARLSVSKDESVSIERQIESGIKYAEARGWNVIRTIADDGVSATHNKPEDRRGWRELLALSEDYQAVVCWKVDRLARRVLDFLHADEALQQRGAAVVSVSEPIDMTTGSGRAFATMLAVFAELEADSISARVSGARNYLIKSGRAVGGTVPYGFRNVANSSGQGKVLAHDPEKIEYVRGMVKRALAGDSIYSIKNWLDEMIAPLPVASQKNRVHNGWHYSTVERLLRSPVLAGMTAYNPGNATKVRGHDVLRDQRGLPIVDLSIAIMTLEEHRKLVSLLDNRDSPQAQPRSGKAVTSPFLAGVAVCGHCASQRMARGTTQGRPSLTCGSCFQTISTRQLTEHLVHRLLTERGDLRSLDIQVTAEEDSTALADIEEAIRACIEKMAEDDADMEALGERLSGLKNLRYAARRAPARQQVRARVTSVREDWEAAQSETERRAILLSQLGHLTIVKGKVGRYLDRARVQLAWIEPTATPPRGTVGIIGPLRIDAANVRLKATPNEPAS